MKGCEEVTLVTSLYFKDDFTLSFLDNLLKTPFNIVLFTSKSMWSQVLSEIVVKSSKQNVCVYAKEFNNFLSTKLNIDWDDQMRLDVMNPPTNDYSVYKTRSLKHIVQTQYIDFLKEISCVNPFKSTYFAWITDSCDLNTLLSMLETLPKECIRQLCSYSFHEDEMRVIEINQVPRIDYNRIRLERLQDSFVYGQTDAISKYHSKYYRLLEKCARYGRFIGDGRIVMNYTYILDSDLFELILL